ncbi:MAG: tyrosine-type recombinase/integrase [Acidimicrobiales bacterium]|jgi:integrase
MTMTTRTERTERRREFGTVRLLPSGRHQAFYSYEGQYVKGPAPFATKTEAKQWLRAEEDRLGKPNSRPPGPVPTFAEVAERWLQVKVLKRASTVDRDKTCLTHILPVIGPRRLDQLLPSEVQLMVDNWTRQGLAPETVRRQASALRAICNFAARDYKVPSPAVDLELPEKKRQPRDGKPVALPSVTPAGFQALADALGPDMGAMMWLGATTGLRWAEAAGLIFSEVDLEARVVHVNMQLLRERVPVVGRDRKPVVPRRYVGQDEPGEGWRGPLKTDKAKREVPLLPFMVEQFTALIERRGVAAQPDAFVFVSPDGLRLAPNNWLRRSWHPAREAAGLPTLDFHDLRRLYVRALLDAKADPRTIQDLLGHKSFDQSLDYGASTPESRRAAADALLLRYAPAAEKAPEMLHAAP